MKKSKVTLTLDKTTVVKLGNAADSLHISRAALLRKFIRLGLLVVRDKNMYVKIDNEYQKLFLL